MIDDSQDKFFFRGLEFTAEEINALLKSISDKVNRGEIRDGYSAYEVAVRNGYKGTEQEWLASLKAKDGNSAYQIAVSQGFQGTEQEWLASLKAKDGNSAYQIAFSQGFQGTEQEWLASLKGQNGAAGRIVGVDTTYEVGVHPSVVNAGTEERAVLQFNLPEPTKVVVGDVNTVPYGDTAKVINVKSPYDVVLSFNVPTGPPGEKGQKGDGFAINDFKNTVDDLPASGKLGETYIVGTTAPYQVYMHNGTTFVNIGTLNTIRSGKYDGGRADTNYGGDQGIDCGRA